MRARAALGCALIAFAGSCAAASPPVLAKSFADADHRITFKYPAEFEVGRYKGDNPLPGGWSQVAVLVDRALLGASTAQAIPRGGVPTIDVIESSGLGARAQMAAVQSGKGAQYMRTFGKTIAYKLPGAFGPFGDQALFYLVPVDSERVVMVIAHKYRFNDPAHSERTPVPSGYEEAIDAILATLVVKPK